MHPLGTRHKSAFREGGAFIEYINHVIYIWNYNGYLFIKNYKSYKKKPIIIKINAIIPNINLKQSVA